MHDPIDASPKVRIFSLTPDYTKAFKDIDNVVDAPPLYSKLSGALVKKKHILFLSTVYA